MQFFSRIKYQSIRVKRRKVVFEEIKYKCDFPLSI